MAGVITQPMPIRLKQLSIRWPMAWTVLIGAFWIAIVVGTIGGFFFHWGWTQFSQNGSLWDWLQMLSAPIFVTALPSVLKGQREDGNMNERTQRIDLQAEESRKQESALEAYQDHIVGLLLDKNLMESQPGSNVQDIARARTLTALRRVGNDRKGDVIRFLHDSRLIYQGKVIVDLRGADLSNANLRGADLRGADLSYVKLNGADLRGADLSYVKLNGVDISETMLDEANTKGAIF